MRRRATLSRAVILLTALLAFLSSSVLVQAHVHPATPGSPAGAIARSQASGGQGQRSPDSPATCPLCQELAHAGAYLLPTPVVVAIPTVTHYRAATARTPLFTAPRHSHGWRSRAPPLPLLA